MKLGLSLLPPISWGIDAILYLMPYVLIAMALEVQKHKDVAESFSRNLDRSDDLFEVPTRLPMRRIFYPILIVGLSRCM